MILDQVRHDAVAAGCARASEHNRDDAAVAALDRGQKVEARSPCIAGLDTVHALDPAQQVVVIGHAGAAIAELVGRKIGVIPGETLLNGPAEDREIACGGDLFVIGQAGGIGIMRSAHAQHVGLGSHHLGKMVLAAAQGFGDGDGNIVGRFGDDGLDGVFDGDGGTRPQTELRGCHRGCVGRNGDLVAEPHAALFQLFEKQVERHHLGDRGGMAQLVFCIGIEDPARIGIDNHGRKQRGRRCCG